MSNDYRVPYTQILAINNHSNADKLEIATVYGFNVIVQKGKYKVGDCVIYIPIDSVISSDLEARLFPPDSKIKLTKSRVRQIRIRGLASQGMLVDINTIKDIVDLQYATLEQDLKDILGIKKYEPPAPKFAQVIGISRQRNNKTDNPNFHKYNGIDNIKWFPYLFQEDEEVVVTEKLHGTNCRIAILPYVANTLWKKIKVFFKLAPKYEKCYGSNNVEISSKLNYRGYYGEDIYGVTAKSINAFDKIKENETIFGEIIGPGIQKNYDYGLTEHKFVLFDVKVLQADGKQKWLDPDEVEEYAKNRGFEHVPILYKGPFNKELIYSLTKGDSVYNPKQKIREGVVIKPRYNYDQNGNKKALKWISEEYLDKDNSDFH